MIAYHIMPISCSPIFSRDLHRRPFAILPPAYFVSAIWHRALLRGITPGEGLGRVLLVEVLCVGVFAPLPTPFFNRTTLPVSGCSLSEATFLSEQRSIKQHSTKQKKNIPLHISVQVSSSSTNNNQHTRLPGNNNNNKQSSLLPPCTLR
eukprot:NODE_3976_length_617_cov_172.426056_g2859_i0.p1 GENE.NODE_3976_length_617_cov_172.426056_g2859_i0~~NODE_3976_length_617_cov_172.426056_g2859_i0.p1  ORF type:complete len:149 (-),score=2.79 NODE_3976_length_617_cov_172.426056_g2859_i0:5-451(-)